jgi:NAD(P)-dependent dehydrogenase (short-subunit alcohol dehydrogenase family)
MAAKPITLVGPATRGLGLAMARHMLRRTQLPVYATYRSGTPEAAHAAILEPLRETVDGSRLHMLRMDLTGEESIANAAGALADHLRTVGSSSDAAYLHTAFFCGGVLHPERGPDDLDAAKMLETFQLNTLSHLLAIKHFARFLPPARAPPPDGRAARWVHVSARVGSVSDNRLGGWYSYRASKVQATVCVDAPVADDCAGCS